MRYLAFFASFIMLVSCNPKSEYPGFSKSRKGFHYQLHTIGESTQKAQLGDYITADISYSTTHDSVFFDGRRKLKLETPLYTGAIEECFLMLRPNESATFLLDAQPFFTQTLASDLPGFINATDKIKIHISIIEIQTASDFEKEKQAFINWIQDFGDYEKVILNQFLNEEQINVKPTKSGLIYLPLEKTSSPRIQLGDTITINYEGRFLNGKFFDSTKRRNQPFQFVFGTEWQVIKGLEQGIARMGEGEKALMIIPSDLGFGTSGSSTGIIPPFTSIIFEVEVLAVNRTYKVQ